MVRLLSIAAIVTLLIISALGIYFIMRTDAEPEGADPKTRIGFKTIHHQDLNLALWYPADAPEEDIALGVFEIAAAPNAPVKPGHYGLVIISHGTGGSFLGHKGIAAKLARQNYIVVGVEHAGSNWRDMSKVGQQAFWEDRPREISKTLDFMFNAKEFAPNINPDIIIGLGHSSGGYSVLAAAVGGSFPTSIARHCQETDQDEEFCLLPEQLGQETGALSDIKQPADKRLSCLVLMAPLGVVFKQENFAAFDLPVLLFRMKGDKILAYPFHAEHIHALIKPQDSYEVLDGGTHFSFIEPFPSSIAESVGLPARDPDGFDRKKFLQDMNETIMSFAETECG